MRDSVLGLKRSTITDYKFSRRRTPRLISGTRFSRRTPSATTCSRPWLKKSYQTGLGCKTILRKKTSQSATSTTPTCWATSIGEPKELWMRSKTKEAADPAGPSEPQQSLRACTKYDLGSFSTFPSSSWLTACPTGAMEVTTVAPSNTSVQRLKFCRQSTPIKPKPWLAMPRRDPEVSFLPRVFSVSLTSQFLSTRQRLTRAWSRLLWLQATMFFRCTNQASWTTLPVRPRKTTLLPSSATARRTAKSTGLSGTRGAQDGATTATSSSPSCPVKASVPAKWLHSPLPQTEGIR